MPDRRPIVALELPAARDRWWFTIVSDELDFELISSEILSRPRMQWSRLLIIFLGCRETLATLIWRSDLRMWIGYKSSGSTAYIWRARRNNFDHVLFKRDGCRRALVRAEEAEVWLSIPGTDVLAQTNRGTSTRIHISENEQVGHQPPGDTCQAFKLGACGWPESSQSTRD